MKGDALQLKPHHLSLSIFLAGLIFSFALVSPLYGAPLGQSDTICDELNQTGMSFYQQAQYVDALEQLQQAIICYQEIDDRTGEGTSLNNIGAVYDSLGQYGQALDYYHAPNQI